MKTVVVLLSHSQENALIRFTRIKQKHQRQQLLCDRETVLTLRVKRVRKVGQEVTHLTHRTQALALDQCRDLESQTELADKCNDQIQGHRIDLKAHSTGRLLTTINRKNHHSTLYGYNRQKRLAMTMIRDKKL